MSDPPPACGTEGHTHPTGGLTGVNEGQLEDADGMFRPMARERILAGLAEAPSRACRRPKRRKTSEMVTMMEIMMSTIMIQV